MLTEYKTKTNIGVGVGFLCQLLAQSQGGTASPIGTLLMLIGFVLFIWGCFSYAKGKGQSQWLGLLGLLSIFGLVILVLIPDKHK